MGTGRRDGRRNSVVSIQTMDVMGKASRLRKTSFFKSLRKTTDEQLKACDGDRDDAVDAAWLTRKNLLRRFIEDNRAAIDKKMAEEDDSAGEQREGEVRQIPMSIGQRGIFGRY